MRRFFIVLGVCALLVLSLQLYSAVKNECCPTHFQVLKAYQDSLQTLVDKVKGESLEEFEKRYHDKEALTYLDLVRNSLDEISSHYKELNGVDDEAAARAALVRVDKYIKHLKGAKSAEAKKLIESVEVKI